jgi:tetratricopeptide (TPR) repeat protein
VAAYKEALRLKKDSPEVHYNLGNALAKQGRLDQAVAAFREAIRLKKGYPEAHTNLGLARARQGRLEEAVAAYQEAIRLKKDEPLAHYNLGVALERQGRLEEAVVAYREAIRLKKDFPLAHCKLGVLLQQQGQFAEALAALNRGHELGSRNPRWPYPSAQWVRQCERWLQLDARLPALLRGESRPASDAERIEFARLCHLKRLDRTAARFFEEALTRSPALAQDPRKGTRYRAACAAALAGCGQGEEAAKLDEKERARWRKQALTWLEADLALWTKQVQDGAPQDRKTVAVALRDWQRNRDLAGIRDAALLAKLPPGEREACTRLWAQAAALLLKAQGKAGATAPQ